jgi:hypothetical protein
MAKPRIALNPKHPERLCWGCEKLCAANDLRCGNGTIRTQPPVELFGEDWLVWGFLLRCASTTFYKSASAGDFLSLWQGCALRRTTFGVAQGANVDIQRSNGSNERVPMHSQSLRGSALIPMGNPEGDENELLFEFSDRLGIENPRLIHSQGQSFEIRFCRICVFPTHLQPGPTIRIEARS